MGKELNSVCKIWKAGGCSVITVPKNIRKILNIDIGDMIIIDWGEVIKKEDTHDINNDKNNKGLPNL